MVPGTLTCPQISIRQNFRLNGTDYYTIFDLPISVTNRITNDVSRPPCDGLLNPMMTPEEIDAPTANAVGVLFAPGDSRQIEAAGKDDPGIFGAGLGNAASRSVRAGAQWVCLLALVLVFVL